MKACTGATQSIATAGLRENASAVHSRTQSGRVLLVTEGSEVREHLKHTLRKAGYEVVVARIRESACQRLQTGQVDAMVLDLGLPVQKGWEVFEHIVNEHPMLPIILLTGQPNQIRRALAAGARALLEKPVDSAQFLQTLNATLPASGKVHFRRRSGYTQHMRYAPSRSAQFLQRIREPSDAVLRLSDPDDTGTW